MNERRQGIFNTELLKEKGYHGNCITQMGMKRKYQYTRKSWYQPLKLQFYSFCIHRFLVMKRISRCLRNMHTDMLYSWRLKTREPTNLPCRLNHRVWKTKKKAGRSLMSSFCWQGNSDTRVCSCEDTALSCQRCVSVSLSTYLPVLYLNHFLSIPFLFVLAHSDACMHAPGNSWLGWRCWAIVVTRGEVSRSS